MSAISISLKTLARGKMKGRPVAAPECAENQKLKRNASWISRAG